MGSVVVDVVVVDVVVVVVVVVGDVLVLVLTLLSPGVLQDPGSTPKLLKD